MELDKFFVKSELIPAVIQEESTGEVLMLAYMNKESFAKTLETQDIECGGPYFYQICHCQVAVDVLSWVTHGRIAGTIYSF